MKSPTDLRTATLEPSSAARLRLAGPAATGRPALRGKLHEVAFWMSVVAGPALVLAAPAGGARLATAVYALTVSGLFGVSALYHRVNWSPARRVLLRRADHAMIFLLVAGTYTPISLVLPHGQARWLLAVVWTGALLGVVFALLWPSAPRWVQGIVYVALGWTALAVLPGLFAALGPAAVALIVGGGVLYTLGAVVYARRWPDPWPQVFGYHELFHTLVVAAALCHLLVVTRDVLPLL